MSKRVRSSDPDYDAKVSERTLFSSLRTAAERLESLSTDTRQYKGAVSLDISHESMLPEQLKAFTRLLSMVRIICAITSFILGRTFFLKSELLGRACLKGSLAT